MEEAPLLPPLLELLFGLTQVSSLYALMQRSIDSEMNKSLLLAPMLRPQWLSSIQRTQNKLTQNPKLIYDSDLLQCSLSFLHHRHCRVLDSQLRSEKFLEFKQKQESRGVNHHLPALLIWETINHVRESEVVLNLGSHFQNYLATREEQKIIPKSQIAQEAIQKFKYLYFQKQYDKPPSQRKINQTQEHFIERVEKALLHANRKYFEPSQPLEDRLTVLVEKRIRTRKESTPLLKKCLQVQSLRPLSFSQDEENNNSFAQKA